MKTKAGSDVLMNLKWTTNRQIQSKSPRWSTPKLTKLVENRTKKLLGS